MTERTGVGVHCYDDHRVAAVFSILGTDPGDGSRREATSKDLAKLVGWLGEQGTARMRGLKKLHNTYPVGSLSSPTPAEVPSVAISRMGGSGKTYIGELAAWSWNAVLGC